MEDMIALDVTAPTRLRVRNVIPSLLLAQKFLPIFRGAGSAHFAEHSGKVLLRLETNVIVDRITETLLAPEVAFRCLHGDVTQQKLNRFWRALLFDPY
jgi:hypothetical protein